MSYYQDYTQITFSKQPLKRPGNFSSQHSNPLSRQNHNDAKLKKLAQETDVPQLNRLDKGFSKFMKDSRQKVGVTQQQLAQALSVKVEMIKSYENGTAIPNPYFKNQVKKYFASKTQ